MQHHTLKCWPEPFDALWSGDKPYEVRRDDRDYTVGDQLCLREYDPALDAYSGRELWANVTYKTSGGSFGLPSDLCVLGIRITGASPARVRPGQPS